MEGPAAGKQAIRYDRLGCGMSDREKPRETLTIDYELEMLAALIDHLGLERLSLVGGSFAGCTAALYAARHGERVDRLVLYGSFANGADLADPAMREALIGVVRRHRGSAAGCSPTSSRRTEAPRSARPSPRSSASPRAREMAADLLALTFATDVRETLAEVRVPTLVVHRRRDRAIRLAAGEQLAALIPNAQLVVLEGDAHLPWHGELDDVLAAVAPFLGAEPPPLSRDSGRGRGAEPRERDVLRLVAEGLSDADIAQRPCSARTRAPSRVEHPAEARAPLARRAAAHAPAPASSNGGIV